MSRQETLNQKTNILLVDDRRENLLALEGILKSLDQNLVQAMSGAQALKYLLRNDVAVILLDVEMPDMDGFQTATLIREREKTRHTPIIFLTAISKSDVHVSQGYSLGGVDYIFKPFAPDVLKSKVAAFVEMFKQRQDAQRQSALLKAERDSCPQFSIRSPSFVLVLDSEGRILRVNRAWEEMTGFKSARRQRELSLGLCRGRRTDKAVPQGSPGQCRMRGVLVDQRQGAAPRFVVLPRR